MTISENLRNVMKERNVSGIELARMVGVTKQTVSSWVQGHKLPRMNMLIAISEALECPLTALLDPDPTSYRQELDNVLFRLSESQLEQVLDYALYIEGKDA